MKLILEVYSTATRSWNAVAAVETVASILEDPERIKKDAEELIQNEAGGPVRVVAVVAERE